MPINALNNLDLNLLKVFNALYQQRKTTKVAKALGLTQPGVSHALKRLREQLDDPLFLRVGNKLEPTAKADEMGDQVKLILEQISHCCYPKNQFDPKSYSDEIRIAISGSLMDALGPAISERLIKQLPQASIKLINWSGTTVDNFNNADLEIGINHYPFELNKNIRQFPVCRDPAGVLVRKNHPLADKEITPDMLANMSLARMIVTDLTDDRTVIGELFKDKSFHFSFSSTHLLSLTKMVAKTDLAMLSYMLPATGYYQDLIFKIPTWKGILPKISIAIYLHQRNNQHPMYIWLVNILKETIIECTEQAKQNLQVE